MLQLFLFKLGAWHTFNYYNLIILKMQFLRELALVFIGNPVQRKTQTSKLTLI